MKKLTCIVDNTIQRGSPFWGEHGLAFRLEVDQTCALFDTGYSGTVLLHNLGLLGGCPREAAALILSHGHLDHTGGLSAVLSQKPGLPLYASSDLFRPRFTLRNGEYQSIGLPLTRTELARLADLRLSEAPVEILPGVWTTGEISERPEPEGRSPNHFASQGDGWQPDPYQDDMSLVVETQAGLVVVCGCCHAGLLNTLAHVKRMFQRRIITVLGGMHLASAEDAALQHVVDVLREYDPLHLYPSHCTGERAYVALTTAFGERVQLCPVGTTLTFE
jgi:7,8-dihydropterin-6-yl-methyl-4-(beta-D-ribofuranosyl)aminobenzene 5'-phosphate synthase